MPGIFNPPFSAAPAAPAQDPTVAAYMRALGFTDAAAQAGANEQTANINAQTAFQQPEIDYQGGLAQQAVDQDALGRGVYESGERLVNQARAEHAQQYATGKLQLNAAQGISDVQIQLARALAQSEAQRQTVLAQQQQSAAGSAWGSGWGM